MKTFRILKLLTLCEDHYPMPTETITTESKYLAISVFAVAILNRITFFCVISSFKMAGSRKERITGRQKKRKNLLERTHLY